MSGAFTLTLDTTAPSVTVGAVGGAAAGSHLQIAYTTDETLARAEFQLADARKLELTLSPALLEVDLPVDAPAGTGVLRWFDDVGNAGTAPIAMTGVTVVVETRGFDRNIRPPSLPFRGRRTLRYHTRIASGGKCQVAVSATSGSRLQSEGDVRIWARARAQSAIWGTRSRLDLGVRAAGPDSSRRLRTTSSLAIPAKAPSVAELIDLDLL